MLQVDTANKKKIPTAPEFVFLYMQLLRVWEARQHIVMVPQIISKQIRFTPDSEVISQQMFMVCMNVFLQTASGDGNEGGWTGDAGCG